MYISRMNFNHYENQEKMAVGVACATITRSGWELMWDNAAKVWDVETPNGWRTACNAADLWKIIRENR